jgi:hypothetical protein
MDRNMLNFTTLFLLLIQFESILYQIESKLAPI